MEQRHQTVAIPSKLLSEALVGERGVQSEDVYSYNSAITACKKAVQLQPELGLLVVMRHS